MKITSRHSLAVGAASLIVATAAFLGCKDFLADASTPQGTLSQATLETRAGVEGTLIGAYRTLDCTSNLSANWGCAASNWVWGSVASDDSYKGSDATDQPPINDIETFHWAAPDAQDYLNVKWQISYEGVVRANSTLRLLAAVQKSSPGAISAEDAKGIAGEAIFLRAHYHFEAYRMWGNIPYYREDDNDFAKPNLTSDQVVTELLKDLDSAIKLLPATPRNAQKGRATQWTAKAYKGRVQAYAGQWPAAVATLQDVVNNGPYALEPSFDRVWTGFKDKQDGPETIWAYQASSNDGEPDGNNANYGERLNFPYSGSHFGCCGFNQPTQNLVNFYRVDANGLPLALSDPTNWNANNDNFTAANKAAVDPRLDWTVGRDGVPYKDWGLYSTKDGWVRDLDNGGPYSPKKNAHEKASGAESNVGWQNTQLNSVHIHLFRFADVLLLLAEGYAETGNLEGARKIVNQVRARAAVSAQGPGTSTADMAVPINDPSITWATYKVGQYPAFPNQVYARDAIRAERRLELALEGQRLFDLRRWGIADVTMNGYVNGVGGGAEKARRLYLSTAEPFAARHKWYPIPDLQIKLSQSNGQSNLKQNAGW
ncbi:MAG TPA: RagB/SusD family nutrient uptake outer membrane protein [Gemmatimonadaceae bacterium]|nr:RagB/SusD family nutrient uptake outer membrane protein [Gemmatimonadaceae bacterium]